MHASRCHACLLLLCMPLTAMYASHCHICLLLSCMPSTAMHASHCHACLLLPCMPFIVMHASYCHACQDIPTLATFLLCNEYSPTQVPLFAHSLTAVYLLLPYISHCHACLLLLCMSLTVMHVFHCRACQDSPDIDNFFFVQSYLSIFRKELIDALISNLYLY
jgi:hypothetical protein